MEWNIWMHGVQDTDMHASKDKSQLFIQNSEGGWGKGSERVVMVVGFSLDETGNLLTYLAGLAWLFDDDDDDDGYITDTHQIYM